MWFFRYNPVSEIQFIDTDFQHSASYVKYTMRVIRERFCLLAWLHYTRFRWVPKKRLLSNLWFHSNMILFFLFGNYLITTMILVIMIPSMQKNVYYPFVCRHNCIVISNAIIRKWKMICASKWYIVMSPIKQNCCRHNWIVNLWFHSKMTLFIFLS